MSTGRHSRGASGYNVKQIDQMAAARYGSMTKPKTQINRVQSTPAQHAACQREAFLRRRRWRIEDRWLKMKGMK